MGKLASHLAESISWGPMMLATDSMDFESSEMQDYTPPNYESRAKILEAFDESVAKTREVVASTSDADWMSTWTMKKGEEVPVPQTYGPSADETDM